MKFSCKLLMSQQQSRETFQLTLLIRSFTPHFDQVFTKHLTIQSNFFNLLVNVFSFDEQILSMSFHLMRRDDFQKAVTSPWNLSGLRKQSDSRSITPSNVNLGKKKKTLNLNSSYSFMKCSWQAQCWKDKYLISLSPVSCFLTMRAFALKMLI